MPVLRVDLRLQFLTQDGQACYERCKGLLADLDEFQAMFQYPEGAPLRPSRVAGGKGRKRGKR